MRQDDLSTFLASVRRAKLQYLRAVSRTEELRRRCESVVPVLDALPGPATPGRQDGPLVALAYWSSEIAVRYHEWELCERNVERFLDRLPDDRCRELLRLRYVDMLDWQAVEQGLAAVGMPYSRSQIFRLHGRALEEARTLFERERNEYD